MYIVRWLKGHPLISIWVLGFIAILLTWSGSSNNKKESAADQKVEMHAESGSVKSGGAIVSGGKDVAQNNVPQENAPQDNAPQDNAPQDNAVHDSMHKEKKNVPENTLKNVQQKQTRDETVDSTQDEMKSGEIKGAVADLETSSEEDMLLIAREAYWNNGLDEAAQIYQQLIKLEPEVLDYKGELGNVYWRQGYPKKAAELYSVIATPLINKGKTEEVANMLGFIGLFYPDRAAQINDHLQAKVNEAK